MTEPTVHGWGYVAHTAQPPVTYEGIVERQLVAVFNAHDDDEARRQLATWNPRLSWDRVLDLREMADDEADAERAGVLAEVEWAQERYELALRELAQSARATGQVAS